MKSPLVFTVEPCSVLNAIVSTLNGSLTDVVVNIHRRAGASSCPVQLAGVKLCSLAVYPPATPAVRGESGWKRTAGRGTQA
ncbi:hypothetical protein QQF64_005614 [Cirrhinus molitorella]|uniref:Uncharacterized protein n=1 Tax=Cirrhinus molitorella TaxID=172907 RepID=A0ABR3MD93_9TELE